jgi:hypothetical protein
MKEELEQMNVHLERIAQILKMLEEHLGAIRERLDAKL